MMVIKEKHNIILKLFHSFPIMYFRTYGNFFWWWLVTEGRKWNIILFDIRQDGLPIFFFKLFLLADYGPYLIQY